MTDQEADSASDPAAELGASPKIPYWHVWTDETGRSRQTRCEINAFAAFTFKGVGPGVSPQWNDKMEPSQAGVTFTVLPVGWVGEWHENPKPQWIIPLSGAWFVETMDGQRVEMGPGEISFGEDQGTKPDEHGNRGHLSGTVGDQPAVLMILQQKSASAPGALCRFK